MKSSEGREDAIVGNNLLAYKLYVHSTGAYKYTEVMFLSPDTYVTLRVLYRGV